MGLNLIKGFFFIAHYTYLGHGRMFHRVSWRAFGHTVINDVTSRVPNSAHQLVHGPEVVLRERHVLFVPAAPDALGHLLAELTYKTK